MAANDRMNDDEAQTPAALPGKKSKKPLIIAAAVLVLALGGAGAWFFLLQPAPATETAEGAEGAEAHAEGAEAHAETVAEHVDADAPIEYLALEPAFIINFPYQGKQRFLQASLTVMSRDPEGLAAVTEHMPAIRHNLINLFSAQMLSVAESPATGIEPLRQLVTREIQDVLIREYGSEGIEEVLFTAFVMQ
ncbi:MAG: flagellar basal body-associated FliL family protein [Gammaproteobacteria bacterium]|nr:flagellar basal body-associated FliL family protein [Gammaproteobacteria bacterium]